MNNLTLGWDLGGAHVKAVLLDADGVAVHAIQVPCPLWRGMDCFHQSIDQVLKIITTPVARHAVTMTGELADIFHNRNEGVQQLSSVMFDRFGPMYVRIYAGRHGFVTQSDISSHLSEIASANWHASASFLAAQAGNALLMDIGSTTSDLMVLHQGRVAVAAYTDAERMCHDELIYTGVIRTPVMAVVQRVPFNGAWQGVAAEHFATMADVYRLTGELPEGCDMADTADGTGKSLEESACRLARMVGRDFADASLTQWQRLAFSIKSSQLRILHKAVERVWSRGLLDEDAPLIGVGVGRFLVAELAHHMGRSFHDVSEWVQARPAVADWAIACLPAYAVGRLGMKVPG